jgi:hypothetical protein
MRLVNGKNQTVVVEFDGDKTIIHNKFLEREMKEMGILVPEGLRSHFGGKECIYFDDLEFQKAFKEIYYLTCMDATFFQWK